MADDIKSLAARIKTLEDAQKKPDPSYQELKRQVSYITDILNTQNSLVQWREDTNNGLKHIGESIKNIRDRVTKLENP